MPLVRRSCCDSYLGGHHDWRCTVGQKVCNRLLRKEDVAGVCTSPEICWEYNETARCGPCALAITDMGVRPIVHFIGFRGEEYWSAVRVWGKPHMIHMGWDRRAQRDIHPLDTVIFGPEAHEGRDLNTAYNYPDTKEVLP